MSEYSSDHAHSAITQSDSNNIRDFYNIVRGKSEEFGIEGYRISKKPDLLIIHEHSIEKAKKRDIYYDSTKRSKEPSSVTYSPTHQKINNNF